MLVHCKNAGDPIALDLLCHPAQRPHCHGADRRIPSAYRKARQEGPTAKAQRSPLTHWPAPKRSRLPPGVGRRRPLPPVRRARCGRRPRARCRCLPWTARAGEHRQRALPREPPARSVETNVEDLQRHEVTVTMQMLPMVKAAARSLLTRVKSRAAGDDFSGTDPGLCRAFARRAESALCVIRARGSRPCVCLIPNRNGWRAPRAPSADTTRPARSNSTRARGTTRAFAAASAQAQRSSRRHRCRSWLPAHRPSAAHLGRSRSCA